MKGTSWERLAKQYLLPYLSGYLVKGSLIFDAPIGELLRFVLLETSAFSARIVRLSVAVQPLYVPSENIVLSYGSRLVRGTHFWEIDPEESMPAMEEIREAILTEGLPFLSAIPDPAALATFLAHRRADKPRDDVNDAEAQAYSHLLAGDLSRASAILTQVATMARHFDPAPAWPHEVANRCAKVAAALADDPERARALLRQWRRATLTALKLDPWALPD